MFDIFHHDILNLFTTIELLKIGSLSSKLYVKIIGDEIFWKLKCKSDYNITKKINIRWKDIYILNYMNVYIFGEKHF